MDRPHHAPLQQLSIALLCAAVIAFALIAGTLQFTRTDLDPIAMPLSTYLRGPGGFWLRDAYYLMAASIAVFAFAGYRSTATASLLAAGADAVCAPTCGAINVAASMAMLNALFFIVFSRRASEPRQNVEVSLRPPHPRTKVV